MSAGLIPENDKKAVSIWLKGMCSDIIQMREANAKILSNYLNKGISRNNMDATNYKEVCTIIFNFLDTHKELDEKIISKFKNFMLFLSDDSVSNEDKYKITEQFYDIKMKLVFQEKGREILEFINKRCGDNIEYKNKIDMLISIILDDTKTIIERKNAQVD